MDKVILHWSYRDLHELPTEMQNYGQELMEVYLKENFLTSLPTWLFEFVNLRFINLTGNLLVTLPDELVLLVNLEVLVVSKNRLETLPRSIQWMKNLKELQVNDNQLSVLPPEIGQVTALELLDCSNNLLNQIPQAIEMCYNLREVNFDGNKQLQDLPSGLFRLPHLHYISANQCALKYLPPTIEGQSLTFVRVFHNSGLMHIPLAFETFVLESNNLWDIDFEVPNSYCHCIYRIPAALTIPKELRILKTCKNNVFSLYELALQKAFECRINSHEMPENLKTDLGNGPTGRCGHCDTPMFNECAMLLMNRRKNFAAILFSQIFCSQFCIHQWRADHKEQYSTVCWPLRKLSIGTTVNMDTS